MTRRRGVPTARLGAVAEWIALIWLWLKGYRLLDRRWRYHGGELDLIMRQRRVTVFVEVKARSSDLYGGALAAVDEDKQRRIIRLAAAYLSRHSLWERPCRFDVIIVEGTSGACRWRMRHIKDAFRAELGRQL